MSRVSITKRLAAIRTAIKTHDPRGYAIHHLPAKLRSYYDVWRTECDRIAATYTGNQYRALLDGEDMGTPPLPAAVSAALDPDPYLAVITPEMTLDEVQEVWNRMLENQS